MQWGSEYQTRSVFKWSKPGLLRNGSNLKWHSNPKVFVQISNGFGQNDYDRHSKQEFKNFVFECIQNLNVPLLDSYNNQIKLNYQFTVGSDQKKTNFYVRYLNAH